ARGSNSGESVRPSEARQGQAAAGKARGAVGGTLDGDLTASRSGGGGERSEPAVSGINRPRKNSLDEMTIRRTEVPVATARPRKPDLDEMGPGSDAGVPLDRPAPAKPRSIGGR